KEKGLRGIKSQNHAGDLVYAYGSSTYERSGDGWKSPVSPSNGVSTVPDIENTAPPSGSKQLIDKLAAMVDLPPPGVSPKDDTVISEELEPATESIQPPLR